MASADDLSLDPTALARARATLLLFGAWIAFFAMLAAVSLAIAPRSITNIPPLLGINLTGAVAWTALSVAIGAYHLWLRRNIASGVALFAAHLPGLVVAALVDVVTTRWAIHVLEPAVRMLPLFRMALYYVDYDVVAYLVILAGAELLLARRAVAVRHRVAARLEASIARARLDFLEAQLQPHFLFNSLGAVSELAFDAPAAAARVLNQLAAIFRTALARKTDEITLGEELSGIEPYLDIQRIRFADWLTIERHVDAKALDYLLPRFVLQPLVENAIRHGLSGRSSAGTIEIAASVVDGELVIRVIDNGIGFTTPHSTAGRGIGLTNVRDRLLILYGTDDSLHLFANDTGGTVAELRIPARRRGEPSLRPQPALTIDTTIDAGTPTPVSIPPWLRHAAVVVPLAWFLAGLVWTQQSFLVISLSTRGPERWLSIAARDMTSAALWAAITPLLLWLCRVFPLRRGNLLVRGLLYVVAACALTLLQVVAWRFVTRTPTPLLSDDFEMSYVVGFLTCCVLVAIGHRRRMMDWIRAREAAALELRSRLDDAQRRARALQHIPPVLLRALDAIAGTARRDPAATERQLTTLADYVRLALECSDARGITPDRAAALDAALDALIDCGAYPPRDLTLSA